MMLGAALGTHEDVYIGLLLLPRRREAANGRQRVEVQLHQLKRAGKTGGAAVRGRRQLETP